jgi:hypothetical protein
MLSKSTSLQVTIPCAECGTSVTRYPSQIVGDVYCSRSCAGEAKRMTADRFWARVDKGGDCWERQGGRTVGGYGRVGNRGQVASRFAWELASGQPLPDGMEVCHTCDNPPCVRNDDAGVYVVDGIEYQRFGHLFLAPHEVNSADRDAKKRTPQGDKHPRWNPTNRGKVHARTCELCGKAFASRVADQRFCSYSCSSRARPSAPKKDRTKLCAHCNEPFKAERTSHRYCSIRCASHARYHLDRTP